MISRKIAAWIMMPFFAGRKNMRINTNQNAASYCAGGHSTTNSRTTDDVDYHELLRQKTQEMLEKLQNGETEPTYQTGSGSYTVKEWRRLIDRVDAVEDKLKEEQELREEKIKEEQIKKEQIKKEQIKKEQNNCDIK